MTMKKYSVQKTVDHKKAIELDPDGERKSPDGNDGHRRRRRRLGARGRRHRNPPAGRIDELVDAKLKKLNITPSGLCSDSDYLRRAYLDIIGTLPTASEAREFLKDARPN